MTRLIYTYYGDDFTGSTDVLEALAAAGVRSVLFVDVPSESQRRRFADCQAIGIAGESRSRTPEWMSKRLPGIFGHLAGLGAPILHYKTCSTFDSSAAIGSIGRALEIGREAVPGPIIPIVVAAPHLGRFVAFGNLFAAAGDNVYRLDRHPTMRSHPVTPMHEADLRRHLAAQTALRIGAVELPALALGTDSDVLGACIASGDQAVLFDGVSKSDLARTGRLLWRQAQTQPLFCAGSSGLTYALLAAWRQAALIPAESPVPPDIRPVDTLLVMSGSCSPVTARQIQIALREGYHGIAIDPTILRADGDETRLTASVAREAVESLSRGRSTVVYSALGRATVGTPLSGDRLGRWMGALLVRILAVSPQNRRVLLAGGDTSSHAVAQLGISALTWAGNLEPGAPLCQAHAENRPDLDGLELVLKGGQVGTDGFFERVRRGR